MGKATRELKEALKNCYQTENESLKKNGQQQDQQENQDYTNETDYDEYSDQEDEEYYTFETTYILRQRLFEYVEDHCEPLCEFLSLEELDNYIEWLFMYGA